MAENELTIEDVFEGAMTDLGNPTQGQLNPTVLWQKMLDSFQYYLSRMHNASKLILLAKKTINISQGIEEYPLADIQSYSEGIFLEINPDGLSAGHSRRIIPIVDVNSQAFHQSNFRIRGDAFVIRDNATKMLSLRLRPVPYTDYTVTLWYKPTRMEIKAGMKESPVEFEQFYVNVRKRAALAALPHSKIDKETKRDIRDGLIAELQSHDAVFDYFTLKGSDIGGEKRPSRTMIGDGY